MPAPLPPVRSLAGTDPGDPADDANLFRAALLELQAGGGGLNWRGPWLVSAIYQIDDVVTDSGNTYRSPTVQTSSGTVDTFTRADGAIGSTEAPGSILAWTTVGTGTGVIVSNKARLNVSGSNHAKLVDLGSAANEVTAEFLWSLSAFSAGVVLRSDSTMTNHYFASYLGNAISLFRNSVNVANLTGQTNTAVTKTVRATFEVATGTVRVYLDGVLKLTYVDATPLTGTYAGFRANTGGVDIDFDNWSGTANTVFVPANWDLVAAKGDAGAAGGVYTRTTAAKTTALLAAGARETGTITLTGAAAYRGYRIATDRPARVRLYASTAQRDVDTTRAIGTDPAGDHGVMLDYVTTAALLAADLSPTVDGYINGTAGAAAITIDNLSGSTSTVTVTLTYVRTE